VIENPGGDDRMTLRIERDAAGAGEEAQALEATLRDVTKVRGEVSYVAPGSLPNDGKVIEDARKLV
jgi:phenylacetate-CoA ligase